MFIKKNANKKFKNTKKIIKNKQDMIYAYNILLTSFKLFPLLIEILYNFYLFTKSFNIGFLMIHFLTVIFKKLNLLSQTY